jgi:hypothetical protein
MSEVNLHLLEDLENVSKTRDLAQSDLDALRAVASWIENVVARPHKDLGRAGPVCPFVPKSLELKTLWLAPENVSGSGVLDAVELVRAYQKIFLNAQPMDGDAIYKSIVVVFTDLSPERAGAFFVDVLKALAVSFYEDDGLVMGSFFEGNEGAAIYNPAFRPFTSPVPFLLIRQAVTSDWKFFLDDEAWLKRWAQRHEGSGAEALAKELRRLPWRAQGD